MAKYIVRFLEDMGVDDVVLYETCVSCFREDAVDRAIDQHVHEKGTNIEYDYADVEEVKP